VEFSYWDWSILIGALIAGAACLYLLMRGQSSSRPWSVAGLVAAGALLVVWFPGGSIFNWLFARVEVPAGSYLVRVQRWGEDLPQGKSYSDSEILAPDEQHKGVMLDVKGEGRYFLNPFLWSYEIHPMVEVPAGKVLVLTRMYGQPIPPERLAAGDFLAQDGERGIVAEALKPGKYRLNPYAYTWKLEDAVEVGAGEVGVLTLKVGKDTADMPFDPKRGPYVVAEGYRGVQEKPLSGGTYYVNPYVKTISRVDTRSHQAEFTDIEFPSKDGFHIKPHVTVTYRILESKAPELFVTLSDNAELPLGDKRPEEIEKNPVLQKAVLPLIRGYARIEGSKMAGRDFVAQSATAAAPTSNPREVLQEKLMAKVVPACAELGVVVESVTIGSSEKDADLEALATQISDREQARLEREKNASLIEQYKQAQELAGTKARKEQNEEKVAATTKLKTATIEAEQKLEVEQKRLEQDLKNAETNLKAAKEQAEAVLAQAEADAEVITKENEAKVAGLRTAIQGFNTADQFAQYQMLTRLAPALKEIFASDTSDFAKLFASYMTQPPSKSTPIHAASTGEPSTPVMPPAEPTGK
jgi:regulator of protease activity HflC (stomatin/prohibitin superfamily)